MKKIFWVLFLSTLTLPIVAHAKIFQAGADLVVPYRTSSPSGRLATLAGIHGDVFLNDYVSLGAAALWGVTDRGFAEEPFYLVPGFTLYIPSPLFQPFLRANVPLLLNNNKNIGIQGGVGLLWNILAGVGIEYSIDVARYFDPNETIVNWVHLGAVFTF